MVVRFMAVRFGDVLKEGIAAQRGQGVLWLPVFLGLGVALYFALPREPAWFWAAGACLAALGLVAGGWRFPVLRLWGGFVLCAALGFSLAQYRTLSVYTPILAKKMAPVRVEGRLEFLEPLEEGKGQRAILKDLAIEDLSPGETPRRVRIKLRKGEDLRIGQGIGMLAGLNPPSAPVLPGGFDFQRYMFFKGIGATGFSYGAAEILEDADGGGFSDGFEALRHGIAQRIEAALSPLSFPQSSVAVALMTGMRGGISADDREAIRAAGLAHMLAISGLHIGLFSGVIFFFVRLFLSLFPVLALRYPIKKYAAVCGMLAAVFYMAVAGASIPTQRAVLMSALVFLAIILDRSPLSMRLVAFAAFCVLCLAPESLTGASFQLSFAAVAALVAFYEAVAPWWGALYRHSGVLRRAGLYVLGVCLTTVVASVATMPFALFHFQALAVYGLLGNLLAMPVLTFLVMPFAVLSFLLMPLGLEGWSLPVVGYGVQLILDIAHGVASLEGALWHVRQWPVEVLLLLSAGCLGLVLFRGVLRFAGLVPLGAGLVLLFLFLPSLPFFLFSPDGKLAAFQDSAGRLAFSDLRRERFVREVWLRSYGFDPDEKPLTWPKEGEGDVEGMRCGELGCRLLYRGHVIDVLKSPAAFETACAQADAIISFAPLKRPCPGKIVIDRFDALRKGAHGFYLEPDGSLSVRTSESLRGFRPWTARYQRRVR